MSAPGAPTPPTPPPTPPGGPAAEGAPGAAPDQQQGQGNAGFWGRFPTVPAEMREQLEPHLKQVQGHVTRLEQQLAPFKGMSPQAIAGVANFARRFDANPKGMWLAMAADLQQRGHLHEALDLQALQAVIEGQDPDGDEGEEDYDYTGEENGGSWDEAPEWAVELKNMFAQQQEQQTQQQREQQEKIEDRALQKMHGTMRAKLVEAGYPEDYLTEQRLNAMVLTHRGNVAAAVQDAVDGRNKILGSVVKPKPNEVDLERGVPPHRPSKAPSDGLKKRDPIKAAGAGAEQFLRTAAREAQQ